MASRSHPPTLRTLARRLVREHSLWRRGETVLCACSGGPDSTALLHVLGMLRGKLGHGLVACGVDHGLRAAAADELALAADLAAQLRLPFTVLSLKVAAGANLQARARTARHQALAEHARQHGARHIALGHTADDRAETLLIRLIRGAGPRGLAVMGPAAPSPSDGDIKLVRPLLEARRVDVMLHMKRHQIAFAEDPSNRDKRFLRTRVRHEVIPLLEELNPGIVAHLCALSDMMTRTIDISAGHPDGGLSGEDAQQPLGRAQRLALQRALRLKQPATLRLKGGIELSLTFSRQGPVRKRKP